MQANQSQVVLRVNFLIRIQTKGMCFGREGHNLASGLCEGDKDIRHEGGVEHLLPPSVCYRLITLFILIFCVQKCKLCVIITQVCQ